MKRAVAIGALAAALAGLGGFAAAQAPAVNRPATASASASTAAAYRDFAFRGTMSQGGMLIGTAPAGTVSLTLDGADIPMAADGRFLIAFGRDHGPDAILVATRGDRTTVTDHLAIAPGTYRIEALPIPKYQQPEAEFLKIRQGELDQIKAAREQAATLVSDGWRQVFQWPAIGRVSGAFGAQRVYDGEKGSYHSGEDIAIPTGTPVRAPADGVVILAATGAPFTLEGHLLMIGHGMGLDSAFLHLSHIDVATGDHVRRGQVIGESGMTGRATGPHLHWALTWRGERIDPKLVAGPMVGGAALSERRPAGFQSIRYARTARASAMLPGRRPNAACVAWMPSPIAGVGGLHHRVRSKVPDVYPLGHLCGRNVTWPKQSGHSGN